MLGFLVFERDDEHSVVHYIFVKETFQKMGIARALMQNAEVDTSRMRFTHWTLPVDELIQKYPEIVYDPYRL